MLPIKMGIGHDHSQRLSQLDIEQLSLNIAYYFRHCETTASRQQQLPSNKHIKDS
jgi:hypothetical protein